MRTFLLMASLFAFCCNAIAEWITLAQCTTSDDGFPTISPNLMIENEIDEHVQQLKTDLDALCKKAKAALLQAKDETRSIVHGRN